MTDTHVLIDREKLKVLAQVALAAQEDLETGIADGTYDDYEVGGVSDSELEDAIQAAESATAAPAADVVEATFERVRTANAVDFGRSGAVWEAYDQAVRDCWQEVSAALSTPPQREASWDHSEFRTAQNGLDINIFVFADEPRTSATFSTQSGEGEELPPPYDLLQRAIETLQAEQRGLASCPAHSANPPAPTATAESGLEGVNWNEITNIVNSQCDDPDADLSWVIDIVCDELRSPEADTVGALREALERLIEAADNCASAVNTSMMDAAIDSACTILKETGNGQ